MSKKLTCLTITKHLKIMFYNLKIALLGLVACLVASCQNEANLDEIMVDLAEEKVELTSTMSQEDFLATCFDIKSKMSSVTRAMQMGDAEAQELMQPFVDDGLQLKTQLVCRAELEPALEVEAAYFETLSDEECAALSFVFHSMQNAGYDIQIVTDVFDGIQTQAMSVDKDRLIHCAAVAVGIDSIRQLGVGGIITATTVRQAIIAIGKRYLGYVGLALLVYDFVECIS